MDSLNTPFGLIKDIEFNLSEKSGLVQNFYSKEVPVIHLLNIVELSHSYGMKADSDVSYEVGQGDVYYTSQYPYRLIILVLGLTGIALIIFKIRMKDDYE